MTWFMPMRPEPTSPPCRSGLPAWAILRTPGKRTTTSSSVPGPVFISAPQPPMLVPLPGMKQIVVTPPATATLSCSLCGRITSSTRSSGFVWYTISLMSPEPPTWL